MTAPIIIIQLVAAADLINAENTFCDWVAVGAMVEAIEASVVTENGATGGTKTEPGPAKVPLIWSAMYVVLSLPTTSKSSMSELPESTMLPK
jgi:hypothetical protein